MECRKVTFTKIIYYISKILLDKYLQFQYNDKKQRNDNIDLCNLSGLAVQLGFILTTLYSSNINLFPAVFSCFGENA